jgi:hypothetical protein
MEAKKRNMYIALGSAILVGAIWYMSKKKPDAGTGGNGTGGSGTGGNGTGGNGTGSPILNTTAGLDFSSMANDVYEAMNGYGTDNQKIRDTFSKLKTTADFDALSKAYNVKTVSSGRGNIFSNDYLGNMVGAIRDESSDSEIAALNLILSSKGILKTI